MWSQYMEIEKEVGSVGFALDNVVAGADFVFVW